MPIANVFDTLQGYLGSAYVNDFNRFGRTYQVIAQADGAHRDNVEDIANLRVRNVDGAVEIHAEGRPAQLQRFGDALLAEAPPLSAPGPLAVTTCANSEVSVKVV